MGSIISKNYHVFSEGGVGVSCNNPVAGIKNKLRTSTKTTRFYYVRRWRGG